MTMVVNIVQALVLLAVAPLAAGVVKNVKARLQNRRGPAVWQMFFDLKKLLAKDSVVSPTTSWIFRIAPFIYFATAVAAAALVPVFGRGGSANDLFILIYLLAAGRFCLALASLDAGSAFGGMGGSREMFISVCVEPALLLAMLTVAVGGGSTNLGAMAGTAAASVPTLPRILAGMAFFMVMIAETGRIPVDNPDTHLELTMIHEGMVLEYSGRSLGLIFWASALKQLVTILLFVTLFIPWSFTGLAMAGLGLLVVAIKSLLSAVALAVTETSTNKMRLFKVPGFLAASGLLSLLALVAQ